MGLKSNLAAPFRRGAAFACRVANQEASVLQRPNIYISHQIAYVVCLFENSEKAPLYSCVDIMNAAIRFGMVLWSR